MLALPTTVVSQNDVLHCDPLVTPSLVDELGLPGVFPADEIVTASATITFSPACAASDGPTFNFVLEIQNFSGQDFTAVWYVADPGTTISNWDGFINGELAFKIDNVGSNQPLISESMAPNGIFQFGEIWTFILDDYASSIGGPDALGSVGVGGFSIGSSGSSGSIIALPIPEPSALWLLGGALAALVGLRGRRAAA